GKGQAKRNPNQQNKKPQPPTPEVKPIAAPALMKKRHWGILTSFLFIVIVPFAAIASYLFFVAQPQYHSLTGFTVRSQEESGANELLGGLAQLAGGATASDNDILYEFIRSQGMVERVNQRVDLRTHYAQHWPNDWFYSIWADATKEDLIWFWNRIVGVSYDQGTGLIEVQVTAFDPETAQALTQSIVDVSHEQINELNLAARNEAMQYAMTDLEEALERLKLARQALTTYRTQTQIVDPALDIQTRMGVMNSLQQELATALVEYDLLLGSTATGDPRLRDTEKRIEVIRDRIAIERQNISSSSTETGGVEEDYPTLIAEFERLTTDREFAETVYFASLQAVEVARDEANRSSRYLATYINPTRADTSEYPRVFVLSGLSFLFLMLAWSIGTLIYYSIRDRS
ncbi:MAG: sugar transporter, partial [Pseudomonadota bacterium]